MYRHCCKLTPIISFTAGNLKIEEFVLSFTLFGRNNTGSWVKAADISMKLEGTFQGKMEHNVINVKIEKAMIKPNSLKIDSEIDLGRSQDKLEQLLSSTFKVLLNGLGIFNRDIKLVDLLPPKLKFIAKYFFSFDLSFGDYLHYALVGVSLKLI